MKPVKRCESSLSVFMLCALGIIAAGCAHHSAGVASDQPSPERIRAENERALELARQADLVIDYEWLDRIRLSTPDNTKVIEATDDTLAAAVARATPKRELAVVVIGKPVRYAYQEPRLGAKVNAIDAVLKGQGFTKVVFQLASGTGRPIYRE